MKILLVHASADFSTADVTSGIRAGLLAEGHVVADFRFNRRLTIAHRAMAGMTNDGVLVDLGEMALWASEGLAFQTILHEPDWVLFVNGLSLHPWALVALRRIGARIAGWFTEAPYDSDEDRELALAQFCDVCFVNERTSVQTFRQVLDRQGRGGMAVYLPHAYDPDVHVPPSEPVPAEDRCDVLLIGTGFPERQRLLEAVDWTGIDLRVGGLWPGLEPPSRLHSALAYGCLPNKETARLYGGAKIVLNPHRYAATAESANPRVFEAAACGAFQIADYRAEIAELLGDAVPMFRPGVPWELGAMVRRYLADEGERRRLAALARQRVEGQTFGARARTIVGAFEAFGQLRQAGTRRLPVSA